MDDIKSILEQEKDAEEHNTEQNKEDNPAERISKDMIINDIVMNHPYLAEYIMDFGVHCVGCGVSTFETLEEGFMGHGMTAEEVDNAIESLNKVIGQYNTSETKKIIN